MHRRPCHPFKRPQQVRAIHRMPGEPDDASTIEIAMHRAALLPQHERDLLLKPVRAAFEAFRLGQGSEDHWMRLVDAMNVAEQLAKRKIASDHTATFEAAQLALTAVHDRHTAGGSWTLRGTEIAALELGCFVFKVQLDSCSRGELAFAVRDVINVVSQALAGNASPHARVCIPAGPLGKHVLPAA